MLAHLHHTPRVRPHYPHWARDAVIAAQVGAAALIVVTALEHAVRHESEADAQRSTLARTTVEQVAEAPPGTTTATTVIDLREAAAPAVTPAAAPAGTTAAPLDGVAPGATVAAVDAAAPVTGAVLSAPAVLQGRIDVAVEHGGSTSSAFPALDQALLGPVKVDVVAADDTTVASTVVEVGQVGRIEGLPAGRYHLVLSTEGPTVQPSPDVAVGAANAQLTSEVTLSDGDVLLVAPQQQPGA